MDRSKRFLAVLVAASLLGSSVAWAVAMCLVPPGAYQVTLNIDGDRLAITLDRIAPADRHHRSTDPSAIDSDGLHDEHVVKLATLEACSTADSKAAATACGPAVAVTEPIDLTHADAPLPFVGSSRASPPPASFTILRI